MKNKGFTLIELLAVIIILAIIMLIAIPSVTNYINNSRKETYVDTAKELLRGAGNLVNSGELDIYDLGTTYYIPSTCIKTESGGNSPFGKFNPAYIITTYDGEGYNYYWTSTDEASMGVPKPVKDDELSKEHIVPDVDTISTDYGVGNRDNIQVFNADCSDSTSKIAIGKYNESDLNGKITPVRNCEYTGDMVQGAEFVDGQYTYKYMQEMDYSGWKNISDDGWGVVLTDKESATPVTTKLCTKINGKPIVSMSKMFDGASNVPSIDATSFDTSNVTNMTNMFANTFSNSGSFEILGIEDFNTQNVKNFGSMFRGINIENISVNMDLSKWNMKNATNISYIFSHSFSNASNVNINMKNWKLDSLTSLYALFDYSFDSSQKVNIDVSGWDMPNVTTLSQFGSYVGLRSDELTIDFTGWKFPSATSLTHAFYMGGTYADKVVFKGLNSWDISHITNLSRMFNWAGGSNIEIDLSSWNVSNVTDFGSMFRQFSNSAADNVSIILKNWKIKSDASIADMFSYSFNGCKNLSIDLSGWDIRGKNNFDYPFNYSCGNNAVNASLNLSNWNTTGLNNLNDTFAYTFNGTQNATINVTGWDVSSVTSANRTFYSAGGTNSTTIIGMEGWNLINCTNTSDMFMSAKNFVINNLHIYSSNTTNMFEYAYHISGSITLHNNPTNYSSMLSGASSTSTFKVNYTSAVIDIDNIMNTRYNGDSSNVLKGNQV